MQELTRNAISNLQRTTGHVLSVADFDDIEALDELAQKMNGVSSVERRLLNSPFELCGIKFYPLTVAKSLWYDEKLREWEIDELYHEAFLFWVLTLPLNEAAFDDHEDKRKAMKSLRRFIRRSNCKASDLRDIFEKCAGKSVGKNADGDGSEKSESYGGLVACLVREFGQSPDYWLYEASVDKVMEFYDQIMARVMAEEEASRSASAGAGKAVAPKVTPKLRAFKAFRDKAQELREKWGAENGD